MPGPSAKGKAKKPKKAPPPLPSTNGTLTGGTQDEFVDDIDSAEGWNAVVGLLCAFFELPDITTRRGLKKIHADFEGINRKLDRAYNRNLTNDRITGGIVGIYAKMCADSILRNKIFKAGILDKVKPLLYRPYCRHVALRALSSMTHAGGIEIRQEIAKLTPELLQLMRDLPEDYTSAEQCIIVLCHAVAAVLNDENQPSQRTIDGLKVPVLLRVTCDAMRRPWPSYLLPDHAIHLLASSTLHCSADCQRYRPALTLLAGALRSKNMAFRVSALSGLVRLHYKESELDRSKLDPQKMMTALQRGVPAHLQEAMVDYGFDRCDLSVILRAAGTSQNAFMRCAQDHDLYVLGMELARLIPQTEFSVPNGMYQEQNPRTGQMQVVRDLGLPFVMWLDALPHCATAMRAKLSASKAHLAEILYTKYLLAKEKTSDAVSAAKRNIEKHPTVPYFYYVASLSANTEEGLRNAKKGLKCPDITPFVRFALMQRAIEHAGNLGLTILQSHTASDPKWDEGIAFLTSAVEDAKLYVKEAPPDSRHMKSVSYWYILLTIAMRGPELSADLSELKPALATLKNADDFGALVGNPTPPRTQMRLAQQAVVSLYADGAKEWGDVIERYDAASNAQPDGATMEKAGEDLAAWLEDMNLEDGEDEAHARRCAHPKVNPNRVELYRCSWCGNPSAVLRKCSGCNKTRYCDGSCQKAHWAKHKTACKPSDN